MDMKENRIPATCGKIAAAILLLALGHGLFSADKKYFDDLNTLPLSYRLIGPFIGGRVSSVAGIPDAEYYEFPPLSPMVPPGQYEIRLSADDCEVQSFLQVKSDPRVPSSVEELKEKCRLQLEIRDAFSELSQAVIRVRAIRKQLIALRKRIGENPELQNLLIMINGIISRITLEEEALAQKESNNYSTAPYHYGSKLDSKLANLLYVVDTAFGSPNLQSYEVYRILKKRVKKHLSALESVFEKDVSMVNGLLHKNNLPLIKKEKNLP